MHHALSASENDVVGYLAAEVIYPCSEAITESELYNINIYGRVGAKGTVIVVFNNNLDANSRKRGERTRANESGADDGRE